jgi:diaminopimelate epimerase
VPRFGVAATSANAQLVRANDAAASRPGISFTVAPLATIGSRLTGRNDAWSSSTLLDIGNPHCVTFLGPDESLPDLATLHAAGDALRGIAFRPDNARRDQAAFANGSNLQWARVKDRTHLDLMIYERGEGPTMASGSSASAAASAAFARRLVDATVDVVMPGGTLAIRIEGTPDRIHSVTLSGFATRILDGKVDRRALAAR